MKFEEALPLMRQGLKFKCVDQSEYYTVCKKNFFYTDCGEVISRIPIDKKDIDIFDWGISGQYILSDEWEIFENDNIEETKKIESILEKAIQQTIFNFFLSVTSPFTPNGALFPPLSKPLAEKIMRAITQFMTISKEDK